MQRQVSLEMEIKNLAREKVNTIETMRQMKEDKKMAEREISTLQSLNTAVCLEKKRLMNMIKKHSKGA